MKVEIEVPITIGFMFETLFGFDNRKQFENEPGKNRIYFNWSVHPACGRKSMELMVAAKPMFELLDETLQDELLETLIGQMDLICND